MSRRQKYLVRSQLRDPGSRDSVGDFATVFKVRPSHFSGFSGRPSVLGIPPLNGKKKAKKVLAFISYLDSRAQNYCDSV